MAYGQPDGSALQCSVRTERGGDKRAEDKGQARTVMWCVVLCGVVCGMGWCGMVRALRCNC